MSRARIGGVLVAVILGVVMLLSATSAFAMQIFVTPTTGGVVTLDVEPTDTVQAVKGQLQDRTGIDPINMVLLFAGHTLEDNRTLADYNIQKEATVYLELTQNPVSVSASSWWSLVAAAVVALAMTRPVLRRGGLPVAP